MGSCSHAEAQSRGRSRGHSAESGSLQLRLPSGGAGRGGGGGCIGGGERGFQRPEGERLADANFLGAPWSARWRELEFASNRS